MRQHLTELELEELRRDENEQDRVHLESCAECSARFSRLSGLAERLANPLQEPAANLGVPEDRDVTMLELARQEARRVQRQLTIGGRGGRRRWLRWSMPAAAAVAASVGLWIALAPVATAPLTPGGLAGDVNRDGIVDIVDAMLLARALEGRGALEPSWDLSGDGMVDGSDVERIARQVVRIGGGRP